MFGPFASGYGRHIILKFLSSQQQHAVVNPNPLPNASIHFSFYGKSPQPYRQAGPFTLGFGRLLTLLQPISQDCFLLLCQCLELIMAHSNSICSGNDTEGSLFMGIVFISKEESYEGNIHRLSIGILSYYCIEHGTIK